MMPVTMASFSVYPRDSKRMKVVRAGPMPMLGTTATPMRKDTAATAPHARRVTLGLLLPLLLVVLLLL